MKKSVFLSAVLLTATFTFSACAHPEGRSEKETAMEETTANPNNGMWKGAAQSQVALATDGKTECRGAEVSLVVEDEKISGSAKTGWGDRLQISGTLDEKGVIRAGMAQDGKNVATFSGSFAEGKATGSWLDIYGCQGSFLLTKSAASAETDSLEMTETESKDAAEDLSAMEKRIDAKAAELEKKADELAEGMAERALDSAEKTLDSVDKNLEKMMQ